MSNSVQIQFLFGFGFEYGFDSADYSIWLNLVRFGFDKNYEFSQFIVWNNDKHIHIYLKNL